MKKIHEYISEHRARVEKYRTGEEWLFIFLELEEINRRLARLESASNHAAPTYFTIRSTSMTAPDPGNSLQFTATPQPAGSQLGTVIPTWVSSDPTNAPVSVDPTGLIATVALSTQIAVGESVTLTISATDPTNGNVATGTVTFTVGAPIVDTFPSSFAISQTA